MKSQNSPKGFVFGALLGLTLAGGLWLLTLIGQAGRPVPNTQWIEKAYEYKLALARIELRPKVLVVAGSAAMFGVSSFALSTALGRPVVNLGVNAGVLSPYIQHYARQAIAPGDWVVLPVEYPMFHGRYSINMPFIDYWWEHPGFRRLDVNLAQLAQVLWLTPVTRALDGYRGLPQGFKVSGLYGPQNLDANGDQINSQADRQEVWMRELVERSAVERYGAQAKAWQANWASWKKLADDVTAAGGCAVFVPPPMLDREGYHHGKERRYYESLPQQARAQGLNYVGSPLDTLYPTDHFFDTNYHLNDVARATYTRYLIDLVKPEFARCSAQ
jgi:hypothetical protein